MPTFSDLGPLFLKTNGKFEISIFKIRCMRNFVKIRMFILFGPKCSNLGIWAQNLKYESYNKILDFPNFEILVRFWLFRYFLGSLRVVSASFGSFYLVLRRFCSFRILVSTSIKYNRS